jgi:hypothetical protein
VSSGWGLLRVLRVSFSFFFGAFRRSLLYLRCNWVALNLRFFDIYNITYQKKIIIIIFWKSSLPHAH